MRIIFLNTDYPSFLSDLYEREREFGAASYEKQMQVRNETLFGTADFMSLAMRRLGHEAIDIHANNRALQQAWLAESDFAPRGLKRLVRAAARVSYIVRGGAALHPRDPLYFEVLEKQFRAFRPNIVYNHDISGIPAPQLRRILPPGAALVGQIASPLNPETDWRAYDLVVTSLPSYVSELKSRGAATTYLPLSFDPRAAEAGRGLPRDVPLSFVGSLTSAHSERLAFLERVLRDTPLELWGDGAPTLPPGSPLLARHRGPAWGRNMFALLGRSQITLNKHINIAGRFANNMRLFEATGMGACLLTDWKENLDDLFAVGREVLAYRSDEECVDLARFYGTNEDARARIAAAGRERCLIEHTYDRRMGQLAEILTTLVT